MTALHTSRSIVRALVALAVLLVCSAVATAQSQPSLADIARKEAERRKTVKDAKVITTKDLPESARKPASTPPSEGGGATPGGDQKPQTSAASDAGSNGQSGEASWRGRMTQAREGLRRNEVFLQALQTRVNALNNDFRNGGGDFYQQARVNDDRQKALEEMERVKADVELSKKQLADIEEEARKAGVPPGWLR